MAFVLFFVFRPHGKLGDNECHERLRAEGGWYVVNTSNHLLPRKAVVWDTSGTNVAPTYACSMWVDAWCWIFSALEFVANSRALISRRSLLL